MANIQKTMQGLKSLNILLLGETGVGKTTWINAFSNYLQYNFFEDALEGDLVTAIPTLFTVYTKNLDKIEFSTGVDPNESQVEGRSATQTAKVYSFEIGNYIIRVIDTPGVGDTNGVKQDELNFQNIITTVSSLEVLHGICILIKSDITALTTTFKFCIKELLKHLHRDANKNIMFCFTHAASTRYTPGLALPLLRNLIKEYAQDYYDIKVSSHKCVYYFENEAYRYLAARKNDPPIILEGKDDNCYAGSWNKSVSEAARMLTHILKLKPHEVSNTIYLNSVRQRLMALSRPLAEINRNIQSNKEFLKKTLKEMEKVKANIHELQKQRKVFITEIQPKHIDQPKTVCTHSKCVKVESVGIDDKTVTAYVQECCKPCGAWFISDEYIGSLGLWFCTQMSFLGYCKQKTCRHHYSYHLRTFYDSVVVKKEIVDEEVDKAFKENKEESKIKEILISSRKMLIEEHKQEQDKVRKVSAKFACYLKQNSTKPFNDAIESYMDLFIKEERESHGSNSESVLRLMEAKELYMLEKKALEDSMNSDSLTFTGSNTSEILELIGDLTKLPHSGKAIQDAIYCLEANKSSSETVIDCKPVLVLRQYAQVNKKAESDLIKIALQL